MTNVAFALRTAEIKKELRDNDPHTSGWRKAIISVGALFDEMSNDDPSCSPEVIGDVIRSKLTR